MTTKTKRRPTPGAVARTTSAKDRVVGRLRRICMALPEATEKLSHGEPTWFAGKGKVFAMLDDHHHGAAHLSVWLPQPFGAQEALIASDPGRFFRPPYVGASGWVGMVLDTGPDLERRRAPRARGVPERRHREAPRAGRRLAAGGVVGAARAGVEWSPRANVTEASKTVGASR
jgi:hypothetical protein